MLVVSYTLRVIIAGEIKTDTLLKLGEDWDYSACAEKEDGAVLTCFAQHQRYLGGLQLTSVVERKEEFEGRTTMNTGTLYCGPTERSHSKHAHWTLH